MSKKLVKAHQGTIVYNQGEQPSTFPPMQEGPPSKIDFDAPPARLEEMDVLDNPFQPPNNMMPGFGGSGVPPSEISNPIPASPLLEPPMPLDQIQPINQIQPIDQVQPTDQIKEDLKKLMPGYGGSGVNTNVRKDFGVPKGYFTTALPMNRPQPRLERTLLDLLRQRQMEQARRNYMLNFDRNFTTTDQYKKLISDSEAAQKEFESTDAFKKFQSFKDQQREIYNKARTDAMKNFNTQFHGGNLFPGMGSIIGKQMPFNEGGAVMEKQMEMNFGETPISQLAEGGMKDDGGEKDPVSGNDVPSGSLAKEVRDDVPAMVSEGEFIFPADVTRFIGLNKLMELRQDAKMGLKKMEAMGQLGNPDDAELPDDIPFDAADIIIMGMDDEEIEEKNEGGIIGFQEGTADAGEQANQYYNIQKEGMKQYARKYVIYRNDAGQTIKVLSTANGSPIDTVPAGYKMVIGKDGLPATELPDMPEQKKPEVEQPTVQQRDDDNDTRDPMDIIKQGRESAKITADRLGMDVDEYINLPIKTRFNLLSEELNVMRGGTLNKEKRDAILAGAEGDGIFGGSLIGGVFDMIGSVFDKDNDGSMWTSTDKDGNVRNIFGQIIQTGVDVSKMGILKDGRWTGAATISKPKKQKFSSSGNLNQSLNPTSSKFSIDEKKQSSQARKHDSYKGVTKSDPYASKAAQFKRAEDNEDRRQEKERKERTESFRAKEKGRMQGTQTNLSAGSGTGKTGKNEYEDDTGAAMINKGTLVTKRSTTKKPTKGKTLVQKKS